MGPLIYYPSFEPPSSVWLKFALLYIDEFKPIVPHQRRHLISDDFKKVANETDLISLIHPEYNEGYRASISAVEEVEKVFANPHARSYMFNRVNVINEWRNQTKWTYQVYGEKFSHEWLHFCQAQRIGQKNDDGVLLPESLAFIFMTHLAKEIAFAQSASIITDNTSFDNFTNYSRTANPLYERRTKFAQGIINLLVPKNLIEIPLNRLVDFRNRNRELISAFNIEMDAMQQKISAGYSERDFIDSYNQVYSEISREILSQGLGLATIPFAAYLLLGNPIASSAEYIKEILGALGIVLGAKLTLHRGLRQNETGRYCKKYLTNLQRLN